MKKSLCFVLTVFLVIGLILGINAVSAAGPVKIKVVSFVPRNHPLVNPHGHEWIKMVNEGMKGEVDVKYVGGPEAIPPKEQIEAVRNNVVQMSMLPIAYHSSLVPEAATMILTKDEDAMALRKGGWHKVIADDYARIGVKYLGPTYWFKFYMWSKKPINTLDDLKGMKMRSFFIYDRFQRALGITPVNMPTGEIYTALERGVVDGFCFPLLGPREMGLTKLAKYVIPYPFYAGDIMFLLNQGTYDKLGKAGQNKLEEITANKYEPYMMNLIGENEKKEWELLAKGGVKKVIFPDDMAKKYVNTAYQAKWEEYSEKLPPATVKKLRKLAGD